MKAQPLAFVFVTISLLSAQVRASDLDVTNLELSIRPHARSVVFGDPIYIEATILNRGEVKISGPRPIYELGTFRLEIRDPETELVIWHGGRRGLGGEGEPEVFEPSKPMKSYWQLCLPGLQRLNHPFWEQSQARRRVYICGVYRLYPSQVEVRSGWSEVFVEARDPTELQILKRLATIDDGTHEKGPQVASFGVQLRYRLGRRQTLEISSKIQPGEILDLFQLAIRMQEIYATPGDSRREGDAALVTLLEKFPDVKRQSLIRQARSTAEAYNMRTTVMALEAISDSK